MSSDRHTSLIVVSAPSGCGKSTVLARVLAELPGVRFSVSHTTRAPRAGERDGVQYHFVERAAFDRMVQEGRFLEWADVYGQRYGTSVAELEQAERDGVDLLADLDVQGAAQIRLKCREAVTVFILPPSFAALEQRLRGRGKDDEAAIQRRLAAAHEELSLFDAYDYAIVNDQLEGCVEALESVVRAARCRVSRVEPVARRIISGF